MKIIQPSVLVESPINGDRILRSIERAGRTCYKSEDRITPESARDFVRMILSPNKRHESVLEHESISVRFIIDRGVSHEMVRHRLAAFSQESTRYCNYSKAKFGSEVTFVEPPMLHLMSHRWRDAMRDAESVYLLMIEDGVSPQIARSVLPNSLKTEIVVTANLREWRHIFTMRTAPAAHPQMRQVMAPLLAALRNLIPVVFDDVGSVDLPEGVNGAALTIPAFEE